MLGSYIACPLRTELALPPEVRQQFVALPPIRTPTEVIVTVPLPGLWLSQQPLQADPEPPVATEVLSD